MENRNIPTEARLQGDKDDIPWHLTADKLVSLDDGVIVEASGDVYLQRGNDFLEADFARLFTATNWVFIQGNVRVRLGQDELSATEAEFDLTSNTGWLKNGHVFMEGPHLYFSGEHVNKHWGDTYSFENAKVTTCDGPVPAWSLTAATAQVEIDGYATLTRSAFQVKDNSVLATPWLTLPAKTTRQSGLLIPDAGTSNMHGVYYSQPWFWAWNKDRDMTFTMNWMEKTGVMPSVEYRSQTTDRDKTWLTLDYLYQNRLVLHEGQDPVDEYDGKIRNNHNRFWFRGMSEGEFGSSDWFYRYTLDYTSDQNFLREFQNRMTGFNNSRRDLTDMFGRDLAEVEKNRITEGYIFRDWDRFRLSLGGRYEQDPSLQHGNAGLSTDTTVQRLPQLSAFLFKGRIVPNMPLELEASANTTYMYRRSGTQGMRTEIYPRVSLPMNLKYANLIAEAGVRQTFYHSSRERATSPIQGREDRLEPAKQYGTSRTIPEININAFTQASRVWSLNSDPLELTGENIGRHRWTGIRHIIQPRLEYNWIPDVDQKRNPFYTLDDRIQPTNSLYFTLTNMVTVRRQGVSAISGEASDGQPAENMVLLQDYQDMFRLRLGGGYDFEEATRKQHLELFPRKPARDLMVDLSFNLNRWVSLWSKSYFSLYGDGVNRSDHGLTLAHPRWGSLSSGYSTRGKFYDYLRQVRYDSIEDIRFQEPLNLIRNEIVFRPSPSWEIGGVSNFDLKRGKHYEGRLSLSYIHQCYRFTGRFISKGNEKSYHFGVELLGLN